jgi:hypothetical protein
MLADGGVAEAHAAEANARYTQVRISQFYVFHNPNDLSFERHKNTKFPVNLPQNRCHYCGFWSFYLFFIN